MAEENKETTANVEVSEKISNIMEAVKALSVIELNDLVKALEEEFGVSAAAMVAAAPGAAGAAGGDSAEEQSTFDVILKDSGSSKIKVIKVVREITGLGLKEAKTLVDEVPKPLKEGVEKEEADEIAAKLKEVGATVEFK